MAALAQQLEQLKLQQEELQKRIQEEEEQKRLEQQSTMEHLEELVKPLTEEMDIKGKILHCNHYNLEHISVNMKEIKISKREQLQVNNNNYERYLLEAAEIKNGMRYKERRRNPNCVLPKETQAALDELIILPRPPMNKELLTEEIYVTLIGILKKQDEKIENLENTIINLESETEKLKSEIERTFQKESKKIDKTKREPSGFVKPCTISTELANFLGKTNIQVSRTEVTREITTYIRKNNLQDPKNKTRILADFQLKELFKLKPNDELTYFNLQRFISPHFC